MKGLIHIGANKTASTLLQRRLFAKHPAIAYLGEDCADFDGIGKELETLIQRDDSYFDERSAEELFRRRAEEPGRSVLVFSSEDILTARHPSVCATRLKRLMPDAKVVLVVRNQLSTWPSWYINHGAYLKGVPKRYWRRHVRFEEWLDYCFAFPDQTPVEAMNYWRHWETFAKAFGREQINVLLYEDLIKDPSAYYGQWAELLGLPAAEVAAQLTGKRERNRYSHRRFCFDRWKASIPLSETFLESLLSSWMDRGAPAETVLPPEKEKDIRNYYAAGNRSLEEMTGLPLAQNGYPV